MPHRRDNLALAEALAAIQVIRQIITLAGDVFGAYRAKNQIAAKTDKVNESGN